jgi:hypothetical protein
VPNWAPFVLFLNPKPMKNALLTLRSLKNIATVTALTATLFSCNPTSETNHSDSSTTNPYTNAAPGSETPAGIAPPKYSDTMGITDPMAKDSIKLTIAFQMAANDLGMAYINKDPNTYAKYTLPAIEKAAGGKSAYLQKLQSVFKDPNNPTYTKILSGPIQRTRARLDDQGYLQGWYCLMPVRIFRTEAGKTLQDIKWMGGQSLDEGKTIYFIDITNMPPEKIMQIMPDLRIVLTQ